MTETYLVPVPNVGPLRSRVDKLNRRAVRLGMDPVVMTVDPADKVRMLAVPVGTDGRTKKVRVIHRSVTITGSPITEAGWTFLATLHHEGAGETLVAALPGGGEIPVAYRWANNVCDHCGAARRRNATFLIRHDAGDGRVAQVGRNCLQDFLPRMDRDPAALARWAEIWGAFWVEIREVEEPGWGGAGRPEMVEELDVFLAATSLVMRREGWTSRGKARENASLRERGDAGVGPGVATADLVLLYLYGDGSDETAAWREGLGPVLPEDEERAGAVIAWAEEALLTDDERLSDYEHNLSVVVRLGFVRGRHVGLAASMISAWQRATGASERYRAKDRPPSRHVGEEDGRIRLHRVEVTWTKEMEDRGYGTSLLVKMTHAGSNVLTWFASPGAAWPETGTVIHLKATVKRHGDYKGEAETTLTRVVWCLEGDERLYAAGVGKGKVDYDDLAEEA